MQEKLRACASEEDLIELAKSEGYELSEDELAAIADGRLRRNKCDTYEEYFDCPAQEEYAKRINEIFGDWKPQ